MKNLVSTLLAVFMACQPFLYSQTVAPMFEMPLYFEDAVGNKDTLIVGYDTAASSQNLNLQFGEELIDFPFDSVFEVRAIHWDDDDLATSKKIIEWHTINGPDVPCSGSTGPNIIISAQYPPVTIRYDSTLFGSGSCRENAILSPDWGIYTLQYWWDAYHYCLRNTSEITDSLLDNFGGARFIEELEVEGQGIQELPGFFLTFWGWGPCNDFMIGTEEHLEAAWGEASPNPANDWVNIKIPKSFKVAGTALFDAVGRWVECPVFFQGSEAQVDVKALNRGLYFLVATGTDGRRVQFKFLKM